MAAAQIRSPLQGQQQSVCCNQNATAEHGDGTPAAAKAPMSKVFAVVCGMYSNTVNTARPAEHSLPTTHIPDRSCLLSGPAMNGTF
jgi:hypothetical protein